MFATQYLHAKEITCSYDFKTKYITINTKKTSNFHNIENLSGIKRKVFIKNFNNFSELEDYVSMENDLGHKITYPLKCFVVL